MPAFAASCGQLLTQETAEGNRADGVSHGDPRRGGQTLANRVKASTAPHAALLGADFKTKMDSLVDGNLSAREAQMEQKKNRWMEHGT